jgi:hypothetical protein
MIIAISSPCGATTSRQNSSFGLDAVAGSG